MFPTNMQILGRERDRERLAEAEHNRLVKIAKGEALGYQTMLINWLGQCLVVWGEKLQSYAPTSLPEPNTTEV